MPPLRVYLLTFGIYLLGQSIFPDDYAIGVHAAMKKQQGISSTGPATVIRGPGTPAAKTPATPANADRARRRGRADAVLAQIVPRTADAMITATSNSWLTLLNVFPLAVALSWLYRRPRRNYAEHVVVAIHMLSANALLLLVNAYAHSAIGTAHGDGASLTRCICGGGAGRRPGCAGGAWVNARRCRPSSRSCTVFFIRTRLPAIP